MKVEGRWLRVEGWGFQVSGSGFRVSVSGFEFRVAGFVFRVSSFGFRVSGFELSRNLDEGQERILPEEAGLDERRGDAQAQEYHPHQVARRLKSRFGVSEFRGLGLWLMGIGNRVYGVGLGVSRCAQRGCPCPGISPAPGCASPASRG